MTPAEMRERAHACETSLVKALRTLVLDRLAEGWTPEQISGWLKEGNERAIGCETI
jgi:IS30 family transposase